MSDRPDTVPLLSEADDEFLTSGAVSPLARSLIALALAALAGFGGYRGFINMRRGEPGSSLLSADALVQGKAVAAASAVPLAKDPDWSTLKGPQILTPQVKKPVVEDTVEASDDAPDAADAAADAPETQTAAPDSSASTKAKTPGEAEPTPADPNGPQTP